MKNRYFLKNVFVISVENKGIYAIYCPITGKVFRISREIAIISECLLKR